MTFIASEITVKDKFHYNDFFSFALLLNQFHKLTADIGSVESCQYEF